MRRHACKKDACARNDTATLLPIGSVMPDNLNVSAHMRAIQLLRTLAVPADRIHPCLGCDPCPPAEVFAKYLGDQPRPSGKAEGGCTNGPA